ncbi:hypothetical protein BKA82DRAFT_1003503 [Pisolithus tinctorius]|uniref:C2H2-type domain-containing protein n=1 Tax=Pisolithus tinctorius Marx 270 TaxID=870435 RepID=A0A0C3NZS5_PISTI|nr:hypothetical protein BKA82DRAFT_1003503 [Pisolithus tinctorius]KIO00791.1 hypothetical protein M404DRAFT_1003503 [Pisolithus tinctorius Marx 270]
MDDSKAASPVKQQQHDHPSDEDESSSSSMAAALVATPLVPPTANPVGVNKRYRPAPAKTFQCRGYGDCRMVFSRSEHLARHIRKHTGERPFTCHCSKQFSRLDNLRQHAQTVHADKQDQNERMMRDLTSLHASMAAANKAGQNRGKRSQTTLNQASASAAASSSASISQHDPIKEEEDFVPPLHYRPGTSTGYEGTDTLMYTDSWSTDAGWTSSHPRPPNNHSFRDSSQSFRVPPASSASTFYHQHQSFLPISSGTTSFSFTVPPSRDASRPPTAGATSTSSTTEPSSASRSLPPLAAVVSASIPHLSSQQPPPTTTSTPTQHVPPLPSSSFPRRPHTAGRPGTAPAAFFGPSKPAYPGGPGLAHQHSELPLPSYGRSTELAAAAAAVATSGSYHYRNNVPFGPAATASYEAEPASPTAAAYNDSPFSFQPPPLSESTPSSNLRKRPFSGLDHDDSSPPPATTSRRELPVTILPGSSSSSAGPTTTDYDYGSESRPQSRRLTVMELCNDADVHVDGGARPFLPSAGNGNPPIGGGGGASRPNTSSGLCSSASALAIVDRSPSTPSTVVGAAAAPSPASTPPSAAATAASTIRAGTQTTAVAAATSPATSSTTSGQASFGFGGFIPGGGSGAGPSGTTGGGGVSASVRREFSASPSPGGTTGLFPATAAAATPSPPPAWSSSPLSRRGDPEYQYGFKPQFREYVGSAQQSYHHQQFGGGHEQQQREREQHRERERETRGSPTVTNAYSSAAVGMKA